MATYSANFLERYYAAGVKVTTGPSSEPITTAHAKMALKVAFDDEDDYIDSLIAAARAKVEQALGIALLPQTIQEKLHEWPIVTKENPRAAIALKRWPLRSVSSITYVDTDGATQTLPTDVYTADSVAKPATVSLRSSLEWPDVLNQAASITITYTAGYDDAANVPPQLKHAITLIVVDWYDNRANSVYERETAADRLIRSMQHSFF